MKNNNRRNLIILGLIILAIAISIGGVVWYEKISRSSNNKSNTLEAIIPPSERNDKLQPDGSVSSPPKPTTTAGTISISGFTKDSSNYYFTVNLNGISKGDCNLRATQDNKSVSAQGKVELVTSYYSCSNMKIPITNLSAGKTNINVIISNDGKTIQNSSEDFILD